MGTQEYRATYRVAMQQATSDLDEIYQEFDQLQLRKEILEDALKALEPFLASFAPTSYQEHQHQTAFPEPAHFEPRNEPRIETRYEVLDAQPAPPTSEPVAAAAFAPAKDIIVDPIQNRINRALGLAVA